MALAGYLFSVIAANLAAVHLPALALAGLLVPAGTLFAGLSLTAHHACRTAVEFRDNHDPFVRLQRDHDTLKKHCVGLEQLIHTYAHVINELSLENQALRDQHAAGHASVTPLRTSHKADA